MTKSEFLPKLATFLKAAGLARVHTDAVEKTARLAFAALAGSPQYEQIWAGDLQNSVQIVAVASGERVTGVEFARRAQLMRERAIGLHDSLYLIPAMFLITAVAMFLASRSFKKDADRMQQELAQNSG